MDNYTVENGIIHSEQGIPHCPRWFADGRLAFGFDEMGMTQVDYWNAGQKTWGGTTVFVRRLWDSFRYYLEEEGISHKPEYRQTKIWPFGIEAQWMYKGCLVCHRVLAIKESILIQVEVPEKAEGEIRFKLEFFERSGLIGSDANDSRYSSRGSVRTWKDWTFRPAENILSGGFTDVPELHGEAVRNTIGNPVAAAPREIGKVDLNICIGADFEITHIKRPINFKHLLMSSGIKQGKTYSFVIAFDADIDKAKGKVQTIAADVEKYVREQRNRYKTAADRSPRLVSPYKHLNDFFSLAPLYQEALKIPDCPGAIRAKTTNYWVWGWDGITGNHAACYWGDMDFIKEMLNFYMETADPENGIAHAFRNDMSIANVSVLPAQGMYITLLYLYYVFSGDVNFTKEIYPFARSIFQKIMKTEVKDTGLCRGSALFPDYPVLMKETGEDISALNNTFYYCSVRAMDYLAGIAGDKDFQAEVEGVLNRIEDHFMELFFDKDKNFVVSSIDANTLEKRDCYNSNSIKWDSSYCSELLWKMNESCMEFFENNIVCKAGLREIPVWCDAYDADSNQLHCWWPVTGEYYMRLINKFDKKELLDQWVGWVSYWTKKLMCPEGISCYIDTDEPESDRWTSVPGAWHGYSMRGWYQAAVHGIAGVDAEAGGLTFYPCSGEELELKGLHYRGKVFDIAMKGSGGYIGSVEVGGNVIRGTNKLPSDVYGDEKKVQITVHRTQTNPYRFYLVHAYGVETRQFAYDNGKMTAKLSGSGICRLMFKAECPIYVKIDHQEIGVPDASMDGSVGAELKMLSGHEMDLEVGVKANNWQVQ